MISILYFNWDEIGTTDAPFFSTQYIFLTEKMCNQTRLDHVG